MEQYNLLVRVKNDSINDDSPWFKEKKGQYFKAKYGVYEFIELENQSMWRANRLDIIETLEDLGQAEFEIESLEHSEAIQKELFRLGAKWYSIGKEVQYTDQNFIQIGYHKQNGLLITCDNEDFNFPKVTLDQLKLIKPIGESKEVKDEWQPKQVELRKLSDEEYQIVMGLFTGMVCQEIGTDRTLELIRESKKIALS